MDHHPKFDYKPSYYGPSPMFFSRKGISKGLHLEFGLLGAPYEFFPQASKVFNLLLNLIIARHGLPKSLNVSFYFQYSRPTVSLICRVVLFLCSDSSKNNIFTSPYFFEKLLSITGRQKR